jgi:tetratricopeptide (TPR) repeat protein
MSFGIIQNVLIVLCVVGILILFVRRLPEVVEEQGQLHIGLPSDQPRKLDYSALSRSFLTRLADGFDTVFRKIWHFMLEAKDLKQGQNITNRLAQIVAPKRRVINIGVYNSLKKAERQAEQGQPDAAEETYFEIIRKHPHEYSAYEGLLRIYTEQRKYDDMLEVLEFLVTHNPLNDAYLAKMGNTLLSLRRYTAAIAAYQKSLEIRDTVPARYINIGQCYKAMGQLDQAISYLAKGVDLEPTNIQYATILSDTLVKAGKNDQAEEVLKSAAKNDPRNKAIRDRLAQIKKS